MSVIKCSFCMESLSRIQEAKSYQFISTAAQRHSLFLSSVHVFVSRSVPTFPVSIVTFSFQFFSIESTHPNFDSILIQYVPDTETVNYLQLTISK